MRTKQNVKNSTNANFRMRKGVLALELAKAVKAWVEIDEDVADNGWTKENEGIWDERRSVMLDLADRIYKMNGLKQRTYGE